MSRRGLPIGPPPKPQELLDLPLEPQVAESSPFLRPKSRSRVRPRRRGLSHTLLLGLQVFAVALLAVVGAWTAWQRVFASERLRVAQIDVRGSHFLSEGEVRELIGPALGENILGLDIDALSERLRASPWVAAATVTRGLPDTLRVEIRERVPLALAEFDRLYLMDGDGGLIDIYGPRTGGFDLPIVRGLLGADEDSRRDRARRAGELLADIGELGSEVSEVYVLDSGDLRVVLRGPGEVLLFGDPPYRERLVGFLGLRKELVERVPDAEHFDLRYKDRIYAKRPVAVSASSAVQPASLIPAAKPAAPPTPAPAVSPTPLPGLTPARRIAPTASSSPLIAHVSTPEAAVPSQLTSVPTPGSPEAPQPARRGTFDSPRRAAVPGGTAQRLRAASPTPE